MPRYACASMLTSDSYLPAALVVAHGLCESGWSHEKAILVTPAVSAEARGRLARAWDRVLEVPPITVDTAHRKGTNYTKLRLWDLAEYDRIVYLDADVVVLGPLEELLDRPRYAAAPTMWPPDRFNAGVLVLEPDPGTFEDMSAKIGVLPSTTGGDQGFLNEYFADWYEGPADHRLPTKFNASSTLWWFGPEWSRLRRDLRVLHFNGRYKPWHGGVRPWVERLGSRRSRVGDRPTPSEIWREARRGAAERWGSS